MRAGMWLRAAVGCRPPYGIVVLRIDEEPLCSTTGTGRLCMPCACVIGQAPYSLSRPRYTLILCPGCAACARAWSSEHGFSCNLVCCFRAPVFGIMLYVGVCASPLRLLFRELSELLNCTVASWLAPYFSVGSGVGGSLGTGMPIYQVWFAPCRSCWMLQYCRRTPGHGGRLQTVHLRAVDRSVFRTANLLSLFRHLGYGRPRP